MRFLTYLLFLLLCSHHFSPSSTASAAAVVTIDDEDESAETTTIDPDDPFGPNHNWVSFREAPGVIEKEMESWDKDMNWINVLNDEGMCVVRIVSGVVWNRFASPSALYCIALLCLTH
jgi:hypothetical protein